MSKGIEIHDSKAESVQRVEMGMEDALSLIDAWELNGDYLNLINNTTFLGEFFSPAVILEKQINAINISIDKLENEKNRDQAEREKFQGMGFLKKSLEGSGIDINDDDENGQIAFLRNIRQQLEGRRNAISEMIQNGGNQELPQE